MTTKEPIRTATAHTGEAQDPLETTWRAIAKDTNQWAYGEILTTVEETYIITPHRPTTHGRWEVHATPIHRHTLGACTPYRDAQGNQIHEGDILLSTDQTQLIAGRNPEGAWTATAQSPHFHLPLELVAGGKATIIGNIHDNDK